MQVPLTTGAGAAYLRGTVGGVKQIFGQVVKPIEYSPDSGAWDHLKTQPRIGPYLDAEGASVG